MYPTRDDTVQCPVCNAIFREKRDKRKVYSGHCDECRATFWWKPWSDNPSVVMDSAKTFRGYCGPSGCVCRS